MDPNDPEEAARRKKTLVLLAGGAASLILPLLGVLYLRWSESRAMPKQTDAAGVFEQREGERRITLPAAPAMSAAVAITAPAQPPSAPPPPMAAPLPGSKSAEGSGSLGFIKPSGDYYQDKKPEPASEPKKEAAKPAPEPEQPKAAPAKATAKTKPGKKPFVMPKLQTGKGFTNFKRNQPAAEEPAEGGGQDMSELLKNLPPGAENNPELQKYLQGR